MNAAKAVSASSKSTNTGCLILFGSVFLLFGIAFFYFVTIQPLFRVLSTGNWNEAQATITRSEVVEDRDGDGTTYSPKIHFEYVVDDQLLHSENWSTGFLSTSVESTSLAVVERYPVGSQHVCYVDPDDPKNAVLDRSYQKSNLWGSLALIFAGVGCGMVWYFLRQRRTVQPLQAAGQQMLVSSGTLGLVPRSVDSQDCPWQDRIGPQRLVSAQGRITTFLVVLFITLFWNGISWVLFLGAWSDSHLFGIAFMGLFVLIGMALIFASVYSFMKIFNPVIAIALSNGAPHPGETLDVAWESSGPVQRLRALKLSIIGEEVVTYVRGTTTSTERRVFQRLPLANVTSESEMRFGSVSVDLPQAIIHSFEAPNNKIVWSVEVHGSIPWWPDVHETMPFAIRPTTVSEYAKELT